MLRKNKLLLFNIILLQFFISGCYSYFEIAKDDFIASEEYSKTKIIMKSNDEIIVSNPEQIETVPNSNEILLYGSKINLLDVNKIMEERFDFMKTFFSSFWIGIAGFLFLGIIVLIVGFPSFY